MAKQLESVYIDNIRVIEDTKRWSKRNALLSPALSPTGYFRLDDRSTSDMVAFTKELAKLIRYYDLSDNEVGKWSGFLLNIDPKGTLDHAVLINKLEENNLSTEDIATLSSKLGPHEVLFLAFLLLMRYPRKQINGFSERYLNYYYRDYLELRQKPSIPARGHVIFELNQDAQNVLLNKGTLLDAGMDSENKKILYEIEQDLLVTSAQLASIQTLSGISKEGEGLILTTIFNKKKDKAFTPKAFKTFGEQEGQEIELGFMISSEILASSTGTRTLTLTLTLDQKVTIQPREEVFTFYISGEKQWLKLIPAETDQVIMTENLMFKFALTENISSPGGYEPDIHFDNEYPVLRTVLNDFKRYEDLQNLKITKVQLELKASNVSDLKMVNDEASISSTRLIYPFGRQPAIGSSFRFTHGDLMGKELSELNLEVKWLGLPVSSGSTEDVFADYYKDYNPGYTINTQSFQSKVNFHKQDEIFFVNTVNLFNADNNIDLLAKTMPAGQEKLSTIGIKSTEISSDDPRDWPGYLELRLERDFLHSMYAKVFAEAAKSDNQSFPNTPYTPVCSSITLSYTAIVTINTQDESQFKYLCPLPTEREATVLPNYSDLGYLFLGLNNLEKGQQFTMLWQAASSGITDNSSVRWEYWANDSSWKVFSNKKDDTGNFSASGIITLQIPEEIGSKDSTTQGNQCWIRAVLDVNDDVKPMVMDTLDIELHAATASFCKTNQTQDDFTVLKPESIKSLVQKVPKIKKLSQPYSGFDGQASESEQQFLVRSSARLKHKNRALTAWDYERLVLAEFPEIYMVKATQGAPGEVIINAIIDTDPDTYLQQPLASNLLLGKIESYLKKYNSATITLIVENATFTEMRLEATIGFAKSAQDLGQKLEQDIKWFLSPWGSSNIIATDQDQNQRINIYQSEIINFIKTRDYIELVRDVKILFN